ncbi:MAG: hypothetical protein EPO26_18555 [Chloroflexota bacterium]|nr:MAG: hypothetical protein EPO26_18555 [Chloroflexota bacterium]
MATSKTKLHDERLIAEHVEPKDFRAGGRADARTSGGVPIWALIGHLRVVEGGVDEVASAYDLPREEVEAALAYYRRNKAYIDARLLLNSD